MRPTVRLLTAGLTTLSLLALGLTLVEANAGALGAGTLPTTVNYVVNSTGTSSGTVCPSFSGVSPAPTYESTLQAAVTAATSGQTIYVCAGSYDLSSGYGANQQVLITKVLTIDGYNWGTPNSSSTSASVNSTTQSEFLNGAGFLVEHSGVTISGLTFYENNYNNGQAECNVGGNNLACADSIDVQSLASGSADQGEANVTVSDNLFVDTGGPNSGLNTAQDGMVHFGLGQDGDPTDVSALDAGDVVQGNAFVVDPGFENNALELSDTTGALVTDNVVNYPTSDDTGLTALWFPGFDQALTVSDNTLHGGGIDSDGTTPDTSDPKSGIKVNDEDVNGEYGDGCSDQLITDNIVSGFVNGISMISAGTDVDTQALCSVGPSDFTVSGNTISNSAVYGIYVSLASPATGATVTGNTVSNTDTAGQSSLSYTAGEYDYYDSSTTVSGDHWSNNGGNGSGFPSSINDTSQTITWTPPGAQTWVTGGAGTFSLGAASDTSGSTVTFASSTTSVCTVSGTTVTMKTPGTCTITPTAPAAGDYALTAGSPSNITINDASQTITWTPPGAQTWVTGGAGTFSLGAASDTSGSTVTFASSTTSVCTVSGTTVTMKTPGTCTITPTAPASGDYALTAGSPSNITINSPTGGSGGSGGSGGTTPTTTTTTPPPVTTTTNPPRPSVSLSAVRRSGNDVIVGVQCSKARCAGIAELTKTITVKVEIGHTGKYRTVTDVVLLGRVDYVRSAGSTGQVKIPLTASDLKLLRAADGHRFACVLTVTSGGGPKRETVLLTT
jgi:hypothetical protein